MTHTVSATFKTDSAAREALLKLEVAGFSEKQMSLVATDSSVGQSFNIEKGTKATEGGAVGASAGGIIGAIAGGLAAAGTILIPGVNLVVYGTAVAAAAGAGVGAATGGLTGALVGFGVPEYEAKRYENEVKNGAILLVVEADSSERAEIIQDIFKQGDAYNIAA
ncbi:hypothetical protein [uncultured Kiloniella sp.]|uniref:hypothetical protein n=1 Tax=Kiloniella sp. TaxID=1938587 RepID=UPI0026158567|nr:hypothetical protein [uncultured Kiloniella sp.]